MLCEPETGILRVMAAEGFQGSGIYRTELKIGQGVTGWVAETGATRIECTVTLAPTADAPDAG